MNIKYIISLSMLITLTGTLCQGAAWSTTLSNAAKRVQSAIWGSPNEKLLEAAKNGDCDEVTQALLNGADKNAFDDRGRTALIWATSRGEKKEKFGATNYRTIVTELLKNNADVNIADNKGRTALMEASNWNLNIDTWVLEQRYKSIDELIEAGAIVNAADNLGWTPLMLATYQGDIQAVTTLLNHAADKSQRNLDNQTALDIARLYNQTVIIPTLKSYEPLGG